MNPFDIAILQQHHVTTTYRWSKYLVNFHGQTPLLWTAAALLK